MKLPFTDDRCWWVPLVLALLAIPAGTVAQCDGPFSLACQSEINVTLGADCRSEITFDQVVTGLPDCLTADDFVINVEDEFTLDRAVVSSAGRFRYSVRGGGHPDLNRFDCWGFVTAFDATAPTISATPDTLFLACNLVDSLLPSSAPSCYQFDAATGRPVAGSLSEELENVWHNTGGLPAVTDSCGGLLNVCLSDRIVRRASDVCTDTTYVNRILTVSDESGNTASQQSVLAFVRPVLDSIVGVSNSVFVTCSADPGDLNPAPQPSDFPFLPTLSGPLYLTEESCQYQVVVEDGVRMAGCDANYAFLRTFTVIDWCDGGKRRTFNQLVKVGDREGPEITPPTQDLNFDGRPDEGPLRFPVNTDCAAIFSTRGNVSVTDECSDSTRLLAYVFIDQDVTTIPLGPYEVLGDNLLLALTDPIPTGLHFLRYVANDGCGNTNAVQVEIEVVDESRPVAVCKEGLNISLQATGLGVVTATRIDAGSYDNCSDITLSIARSDRDQAPLSDFGNEILVDCSDVGRVTVALRVSDDGGQENYCWTDLLVEDKIAPTCSAPPATQISCQDYRSLLPRNLNAAFASNPAPISTLLDGSFGGASGSDNCGSVNLTQTVNANLNSCGVGRIERAFSVYDAGGTVQREACVQLIDVLPYHDYAITFPTDVTGSCTASVDLAPLITSESGCDLVTINANRDTLVGDANSCYKVVTTYELINWCEYDGFSRPIDISRDADGDGIVGEEVSLRITPGDLLELSDDLATLNGADTLSNYGSRAGRGAFRYRHFLTVSDDQSPILSVKKPEVGVVFTADCLGGVQFSFTASDDCVAPKIVIDIDLNATDRNGDDTLTIVDFRPEMVVAESRVTALDDTLYEASVPNLPIGIHLARFRLTDPCGNLAVKTVPFEIEDGKAPVPSCISQVSVTLMPDAAQGAIATVFAEDLVASPAVVCSPMEVGYALYREETAATTGFTPSPENDRLQFNCSDGGDVVARLYAFSPSGRSDYCQVMVKLRAGDPSWCANRQGRIAGNILTESGLPVPSVEVTNVSTTSRYADTDDEGFFEFDGLAEGEDYTVYPYLDRDHINGVSTLDILLIARYLLGESDGWSPYQFIAADANRSRAVTILDLIHIRRVLLDVDKDFDNNTSWRFIPADYVFPDPLNPWHERFPEVSNHNDLVGTDFADFVAVKVGDVSGNVRPDITSFSAESDGRRSAGAVELTLKNLVGRPGYVGLFAPTDVSLAGLQMSLSLSDPESVRGDRIQTGDMRISGELLHVSFAPPAALEASRGAEQLLLYLPESVAATLRISTGRGALTAEVYDADFGVHLPSLRREGDRQTSSGQVFPNPIKDRATVVIDWQEAEPVTMTLHAADGRILKEWQTELSAGYNEKTLDHDDFAGAEGLILLTVRGEYAVLSLRAIKQ